jgi:hypothetical protein
MVDADLEKIGIDPPGEGKKLAIENGFSWIKS